MAPQIQELERPRAEPRDRGKSIGRLSDRGSRQCNKGSRDIAIGAGRLRWLDRRGLPTIGEARSRLELGGRLAGGAYPVAPRASAGIPMAMAGKFRVREAQ